MAFPEFTHPDDLQAEMELHRGLVSGERDHYQVEKRYIRKDAQIVWARLTASLVRPESGKRQFVIAMVEDITLHKLANEALRESERSLREAQERGLRSREEFTRQLIDAQEQERQRLAAELHDSLGQNLSIIKNKAFQALNCPGVSADVADHLNAISQFATETIAEVRDLVRNLRPVLIQQLGLTDSLRELLDRVRQSCSIRLEVRIENVEDLIRGSSATQLYRIVQEALSNLIKHSGADSADFRLERDIHCVRLRLSDNGAGFDVNHPTRGGFGLRNIAERVQMLGGRMNLDSTPGTGTKLIVELPNLYEAVPDME